MIKVVITADMTGQYAEDGSILRWPEMDVFGRDYTRETATVQRLSGATSGTFCVIPAGRASDVEIAPSSPAKSSAKVSNDAAG